MSTYTTNYSMTKPEAGDFVDIDVLNDNFDTIDGQMKQNADDIADIETEISDVMKKAVYDTDNSGIVDNAEKVNNHTVEINVPANAIFTDTVYDDTEIRQKIGDLSSLDTAAKSNLVAAINEVDSDLSHLPSPAPSSGTYVISQDNGNMSLTDMSGAMLSLFGLSVVDGAINLTYQE